MIKKFIIGIVSVCIAAFSCTFALPACSFNFGEYYDLGDGCKLKMQLLDDGTYSVTDWVRDTPYDFTVPDTFKNKPVTVIGDEAFKEHAFHSLTIPDSITKIGANAFRGIYNIYNLTIGKGVKEIGEDAFATSWNIPNVHYTGDLAGWCSIASESVIINKECNLYVNGELVTGEITIPDGATSIGAYSFYRYQKIEKVFIPDGVTEIGQYAFAGCTNLTEVSLPKGITKIGARAFNSCGNLSVLTLPSSLTYIGDYSFSACNKIDVELPEGVTYIGRYAFTWCNALTSVTVPNGVTKIDKWTFYGCTNLKNVTIGSSVTEIGESAFYGCESLESLTIPSGVVSLGDLAFSRTGLKSVSVSVSITSVGVLVFSRCESLENIYYGGTVEQWQTYFGDIMLSDVTVQCTDDNLTL